MIPEVDKRYLIEYEDPEDPGCSHSGVLTCDSEITNESDDGLTLYHFTDKFHRLFWWFAEVDIVKEVT